jgi:hypothetical protein
MIEFVLSKCQLIGMRIKFKFLRHRILVYTLMLNMWIG